jgi:hypothetical protein
LIRIHVGEAEIHFSSSSGKHPLVLDLGYTEIPVVMNHLRVGYFSVAYDEP